MIHYLFLKRKWKTLLKGHVAGVTEKKEGCEKLGEAQRAFFSVSLSWCRNVNKKALEETPAKTVSPL